jgi:hypothetical protein
VRACAGPDTAPRDVMARVNAALAVRAHTAASSRWSWRCSTRALHAGLLQRRPQRPDARPRGRHRARLETAA